MKMFKSILIANRGEIACRVIRTAKKMGIKTIAVYSDIDSNALHVQLADEAYLLGNAPASESYLLGDKIIKIALSSGAQAIHPGYGFLSENSDFARACEDAGIVFIGPPASAIEAMGAKDTAKKIMEKAQVPFVPGYHGEDQSETAILKAANHIGYPVLLKATAGGGGKGMRIIENENDFSHAFKSTKREALSSFGDDKLLVEKYLVNPRHIEIQVFCDSHGNGVYLFERDCSIQRRYQKVIEEAPAPNFSEDLRQKMGQTALQAAAAINYVGAGTIEFLLDQDGSFYFMEMNTRLQVEHPVTEAISRQDLVEWQLIVAAGGQLPLKQQELIIHGHAIEVRIYAEDPNNDFLPSTGKIHYLTTPSNDNNVRIDTGVQQGDMISPFYDPMIAKLIIWGKNRTSALQSLQQALNHYHIIGVQNNISFLQRLIACPAFSAEQLNTHFIERESEYLFDNNSTQNKLFLYAAVLYIMLKQKISTPTTYQTVSNDIYSPWKSYHGWRLNENSQDILQLKCEGQETTKFTIDTLEENFRILCEGGKNVVISGELDKNYLSMTINNCIYYFTVYCVQQKISLFLNNQFTEIEWIPANLGNNEEDADNNLNAPMNGLIIEVAIKPGDSVNAGDALITMEAMKMEHTIYAPTDGIVNDVFFAEGDMVEEAAELIDFEANNSEPST